MDSARPPRQQKSSPWIYVGCGCGLLVGLLLAGVVGLTYFGYRKGKDFEETMKDPRKRAAKARELLPWTELPAGYHPAGGFSIPLVMDIAMFSDKEPAAQDPAPRAGGKDGQDFNFGDRGFVYMSFRSWMGKNENELRDYIDGKGGRPKWMNRSDVDLEHREILRRGQLEANGRTFHFATARGDYDGKGRHSQNLATFFTVDCPRNDRRRLGVWFGPDPDPGKPLDPAALAGTNADPETIKAFVSHFRFCQP
jgi:hypothetical protein